MIITGPLFLVLFPLLMSIVFPLAVLGLLGWLYKSKQKTLPRNAPRGSRVSRIAEMTAIGGISLSMLTLLMLYRNYSEVPYALSEMAPASLRQEYFLVLGCIIVCILIAMIFALFHRAFIACIGLTTCFCGIGFLVNSGEVLSYKHHEDEIGRMPLSLQVKLSDDIVGADVWFNGMHIGKTPIETDLDELLAKLPNWDGKTPEERRELRETGSKRLMSLAALTPSRVSIYQEREKARKIIFYRAELDGKKLYPEGNTSVIGGSRMFGQLQPCHVMLGMTLPKWNEEIELLLDQARLANYEVDRTWIEAMQSYGQLGWRAIRLEVVKEPGFNQVLDTWAAEVYGIDPDINQTIARGKFDQICDEANQRGNYFTDSPAGRAVELLVPEFNREEMVSLAENRIRSVGLFTSGGSRRTHRSNDRIDFGVTFYPSKAKSMLHPSDYVLAHAIWKLDAIYDAEDDTKDNPIEERIVASILRDRSRTAHLGICQTLGGTVFERFVLRHDWRIDPDQMKGNDSFYDSIRIGLVEWNRWQHIAATMDSPAGKKFRMMNGDLILTNARKMIRDSNQVLQFWDVERMGFLFLDPELEKDSLAARFWPTYIQKMKNNVSTWGETAGDRCKYLVRMQPHVSVEKFVDSYISSRGARYTSKAELAQLDSDFQFEVLTALVERSEKLFSQTKLPNESFYIYRNDRDQFAEMARLVPCEKSAALMVQWLSEQADDRAKRVARIESLINSNQLPDQQLNAIAGADDAELRVLVLPGIEKLPTPTRQAILKKLLSDHDPAVQQQAVKVQEKLDAIRNSPHPSRDD